MQSPNPKREYDLTEIISLMVKSKCLRVKLGSLEVELSPQAFAIDTPETNPTQVAQPTLSDEDMLLWSTNEGQS